MKDLTPKRDFEFYQKMFETYGTYDSKKPSISRLVGVITRLRNAIYTHREQKASDRCIEDDDRLYEALGDGVKCDRRVGDKAAMLADCARFIQNRCEGGGWKSYVELEKELHEARLEIARLRNEKD